MGTGLLDLRLMSVSRGRATIRVTILADDLLLNLEPLGDYQELNLRGIIFTLSIEKQPDPKGDRVVITMNGKFLP